MTAAFLDHCYISFRNRCLKRHYYTSSLQLQLTNHRFQCCLSAKLQATGGEIQTATQSAYILWEHKDLIVHVRKQL